MDFWITILGLARRTRVLLPAVLIAATVRKTGFLGSPVT